ncbi:MAG: hypothetical protein PHS64_00300 [Candidatus Omnitrophica bacterium]|nr:hypothetical protein [Candidatus Omnitrophota bacterium]
MKVLCVMTHEVPRGGGRFDVYEAGREYDIEEPHERFFQIVPVVEKPSKRQKESAGTEAEIDKGGIEL